MSTKEYYNTRKQEFIKDLIELINKHIDIEYEAIENSMKVYNEASKDFASKEWIKVYKEAIKDALNEGTDFVNKTLEFNKYWFPRPTKLTIYCNTSANC